MRFLPERFSAYPECVSASKDFDVKPETRFIADMDVASDEREKVEGAMEAMRRRNDDICCVSGGVSTSESAQSNECVPAVRYSALQPFKRERKELKMRTATIHTQTRTQTHTNTHINTHTQHTRNAGFPNRHRMSRQMTERQQIALLLRQTGNVQSC